MTAKQVYDLFNSKQVSWEMVEADASLVVSSGEACTLFQSLHEGDWVIEIRWDGSIPNEDFQFAVYFGEKELAAHRLIESNMPDNGCLLLFDMEKEPHLFRFFLRAPFPLELMG